MFLHINEGKMGHISWLSLSYCLRKLWLMF